MEKNGPTLVRNESIEHNVATEWGNLVEFSVAVDQFFQEMNKYHMALDPNRIKLGEIEKIRLDIENRWANSLKQ